MRRNTRLSTNCRTIAGVFTASVLALVGVPLVQQAAHAATTFVVTSVADDPDVTVGDGICLTAANGCTLRAAIQEANATAGLDTINFNIPGATPAAPGIITPASPLPTITETVSIDGYSQPGTAANTLAVGSNAAIAIVLRGGPGVTTGLVINAGPSTVQGIAVTNFSATGISATSAAGLTVTGTFLGLDPNGTAAGNGTGITVGVGANNVTVGGNLPAQRNVISGNTQDGVSVLASTGFVLKGNLIGTSPSGTTAIPNTRIGLLLGGSGAQIGGTIAGDGNVISGNTQSGILVSGSTNTILGNNIGTTADGLSALGNQDGILVTNGGIINNVIGSATASGRNIISGNRRSGIQLGTLGNRTTVIGNWIGVAANWSGTPSAADAPLGNNTAGGIGAGVFITASGVNPLAATIGGNNAGQQNIIANTVNGPGVQITGAQLTGARIAPNRMFANAGIGTAFGAGANPPFIPNDTDDADTGPNNLQNHPVVSSAVLNAGTITFTYSVDSLVGNSAYPMVVDFYTTDASSQAPGVTFRGRGTIAAPGATTFLLTGVGAFTGSELLVATATDANGNTSQFSPPFGLTIGGGGGPFIVTSTGDGIDAAIGNGVCQTAGGGPCTLRAAIQEANANGAADIINFNIAGGGVQTIRPLTPLPDIATPVTIDGYTQPGASANALATASNAVPLVELSGTAAPGVAGSGTDIYGLRFVAGANNSVVRGLVINGYNDAQVGDAIAIVDASNVSVEGNFIGTNAAGTAAATTTNRVGVQVGRDSTTSKIGGLTPAGRNVISGNTVAGVALRARNSPDTAIQNNVIGTAIDGITAIPNPIGVLVGPIAAVPADAITASIGGATGTGNLISGNTVAGIQVDPGTLSGGLISANTITKNGDGIVVKSGTAVRISENAISANTGIGIDLGGDGVTFNHQGAAVGPNQYQNYPVLTIATSDGANVRVAGTLDTVAGAASKIDFYANTACDPNGFGEGQTYLGTVNATANAQGRATFDTTIAVAGVVEPVGISSTASDGVGAVGATSEFSYCRPLATTNLTWVTASPIAGTASQLITDRFQEKWFKFPVSPGAKVKVTLTGQPGSAVTLHRDPNPIYQGLLNPDSAVALSAEAAEPAFLPSGYLPSGYLPSGYLPSGYLPSGYLPSGYLPSGYLPSGYLPSGYLPSGYLPAGSLPSGYLPSGYLPSGYLPSGYLPSGYLPSGYLPSGFLPSGYLPSGYLSAPGAIEAYGNAARRSAIAASADPSAASQIIERNTFDLQEDLYVRVVGPFDIANPFQLSVSVTGGVCSGLTSISGALPVSVGSTKQTVIVTDSSRLSGTAAEKSSAQASLQSLAQRPDVDGIVVDLATGNYPRVAAARTQAINNPACPSAGNQLATEIKNVIDSYRSPALKYVVLAGGSDAIPYYQVQDNAGLANERDYVPPVAPNSPSEAGLKSGLVSGQDFYGSSVGLRLGGRTVAVPGLAVGRLVDSATDVSAAVNTYIANNGVVRPGSSLVTGYDFVGDAAASVANELSAGTNAPADTLIQAPGEPPTGPNAWTATQLKSKLLGPVRHDVVMLTGHFSAGDLLSADYKTQLPATEIQSSNAALTNTLVIALGCHGGYSIPSTDLLSGSSPNPDWAKAFLRKGAAGYVAATGYAYGDTVLTEYGERLVVGLAQQLRTGTGPIPIGTALVLAKQKYLASTPEIAGIDEKTIVQMTLFGLPMMKVDMPGTRLPGSSSPSIITSTTPVTSGPGVTFGLATASQGVGATLTPVTKLLPNLSGGPNVNTTYLRGRDGVVARPFEPLLPKEDNNVSVNGKVLRGVAMRGGTYTDQNGITPLTSSAATETTNPNTAFSSDVFYPTQTWSSNYIDAVGGGSTRLITIPAQFKSTSPGAQDGTLRAYSNMQLAFYYLSDTWTTAGLRAASVSPAPNISGVSASYSGANVTFRVNAGTDGTAGVQSVWALYTGVPGSPLHGTWSSFDLTQDPTDPTKWGGTTSLAGNLSDMRFVVHAVGGAGLVSTATNLGAYYSATSTVSPPPPPASSTLILDNAPAVVEYLRPATVTATLSSGSSPLAGRAVTFDVGGQAILSSTNVDGVASVTVIPTATPGSLTVSASFKGETAYKPSSASRPISVSKGAAAITVTPAASAIDVGQTTPIVASLKDAAGRGLGQKTILFAIKSSGSIVATKAVITDSWGDAPLGLIDLPSGSYAVEASFAIPLVLPSGQTLTTLDPNYLGATNSSATLTVAATPPPTISASAKNADGSTYAADSWTKQNVVVTFTCSSGVGLPACTPPQTVTAEGVTASVTGTAMGTTGLVSTTSFGPVKIDRTGPVVAISTPSNGASYVAGASVVAAYTCNDAGSGTATCAGPVGAGTPIDTATPGPKSFTVNAVDVAGNASATTVNYTVIAASGAAPVVQADMGVPGLQEIGFPTNAVAIAGSFTDADGSAPYKASVRWATGRPFTNLVLNNNSQFVAANVFAAAGNYTVTIRICDAANNCGTDDVLVRTSVALSVTPVRECITDRGPSANPRYSVRFGYNNAAAYPVFILSLPGVDNTFTASPYLRGQPQVFLPGPQQGAFTTNLNAASISWRLRNITVTGNASSPRCP